MALAPLASSRCPKAEEEWLKSSSIQDVPGPEHGWCRQAQQLGGATGPVCLPRPSPTPAPSPFPTLALGQALGPLTLRGKCHSSPQTWGGVRREIQSKRPTWLFRSSQQKGKGAFFGVPPLEMGQVQGCVTGSGHLLGHLVKDRISAQGPA